MDRHFFGNPGALSDLPSTLAEMYARPDWMRDGLCHEYPQLDWFNTRQNKLTRVVCSQCLVQGECREYGVADPGLVGMWGGLSDQHRHDERRARRGRRAA